MTGKSFVTRTVFIAITAGTLLAGCGSSNPDYVAVCVNPNTHDVVADSFCSQPSWSWYYVPWYDYNQNPSWYVIHHTVYNGTYDKPVARSSNQTVRYGNTAKSSRQKTVTLYSPQNQTKSVKLSQDTKSVKSVTYRPKSDSSSSYRKVSIFGSSSKSSSYTSSRSSISSGSSYKSYSSGSFKR